MKKFKKTRFMSSERIFEALADFDFYLEMCIIRGMDYPSSFRGKLLKRLSCHDKTAKGDQVRFNRYSTCKGDVYYITMANSPYIKVLFCDEYDEYKEILYEI